MSRHTIGEKQYLIVGSGDTDILEVTELPTIPRTPSFLLSPHGCSCPAFMKAVLLTGKGQCEHHDWLVNMLGADPRRNKCSKE